MERKNIKIGMFGFGCVGQGLYDVLAQSKGMKAEILKIVVKNPDKPRALPAHFFSYQAESILDDPQINLVVELIDDAEAAYQIVKSALEKGKNVVTANKKMLAEHLPELILLQQKYKVSLLYEGSACGSIPIIRTLEEYYDNELLLSVEGIFNGSSNYILSKIFNQNSTYQQALTQAQELGFAETDPTLDVGGYDPKFKLCILAMHAFGIEAEPDQVFNYGIMGLSDFDVAYAQEKKLKIKLICRVARLGTDKLTMWVLPRFVAENSPFYTVEQEYNAVLVEAAFSDKQFFRGKGAGGHPTGSAVLSDISAISYGYAYEYRKKAQAESLVHTQDTELRVYLRFENGFDTNQLGFSDIEEQYRGQKYGYVIGKISLQNLFNLKKILEDNNVFLCTF